MRAASRSLMMSEEDRVKYPWEVDPAKLVLKKRIGGGTYGMVFEGTYGKEMVAIKRLTLSPDPEDDESPGDDLKSVMGEAQLLWDLRHPRILNYFGICTKRSSLSTQIFLVTDDPSGRCVQQDVACDGSGHHVHSTCIGRGACTWRAHKQIVIAIAVEVAVRDYLCGGKVTCADSGHDVANLVDHIDACDGAGHHICGACIG